LAGQLARAPPTIQGKWLAENQRLKAKGQILKRPGRGGAAEPAGGWSGAGVRISTFPFP